MEKWFSLDSVQIDDTRVPIDQTVTLPVPILTHPAKTSFPYGDAALSGTEIALDHSSLHGGEIGREFCFDETLFCSSCQRGSGKAEKASGIEGAKTLSARL